MAVTIYKKQRQILDFISQYIAKTGFSPTLGEIAEAMGVSSLATVHEHLENLVKKGLMKRYKGVVRGLELLDKKFSQMTEGIEIPILGFIAAGEPLEPYTDPNATLSVSPGLVSARKRNFVLQVRGDSMIEDGILDGDFVVVEEEQEVKNGDIVVALLNEKFATLKKFFREKNRVKLMPANSKMAPIYARNVRIQGKVVGLIRRF